MRNEGTRLLGRVLLFSLNRARGDNNDYSVRCVSVARGQYNSGFLATAFDSTIEPLAPQLPRQSYGMSC